MRKANNFIDRTGKQYGYLKVIRYVPEMSGTNHKYKFSFWECKCTACGDTKIVSGVQLSSWKNPHCGCLTHEHFSERMKKRWRENPPKMKTGKDCPTFKDLTGQKFGMLTAISYIPEMSGANHKHAQSFYNFKCDCGNIRACNANSVKIGSITHCGCLTKKHRDASSLKRRLPAERVMLNSIFADYRVRARSNNIVFTLTSEDIDKHVQDVCHYCGIPPQNIREYKPTNEQIKWNGLDRIDSSGGYTPNNIVTCCTTCNTAKLTMSQEAFYAWAKRLSENLIRKQLI